MLFRPNNKSYYVELSPHGVLMARTSAPASGGGVVVEAVKECARGDVAAVQQIIKELQPKRSPSGYLHATCGVYSPRRLVRRASLDLKRAKEAAYLEETVSSQFRIEPDKYTLAILNAPDGSEFNQIEPTQKEVLFAGMPTDEIVQLQDELLAMGIFPERLEMATVSTLGALVSYFPAQKIKTSLLVLEINEDSTFSYIITANGLDATRSIPHGLDSMVPVIQKELGLKDEESSRKLLYSDAFDFAGMGAVLIRRLLKELQSSISYYEVQTGQSIGQILCVAASPKLAWLEQSIAAQLNFGILDFKLPEFLANSQISFAQGLSAVGFDRRWLGLFGLMAQYSSSHATTSEKIQG